MSAPDDAPKAAPAAAPWPETLSFDRAARVLRARFDTGETVEAPFELLRVESPSAEVQGHGPGDKTLVAGKRGVGVVEVQPVGNYAVRIVFDDGHDTGLFSWDYILKLGRNADALMAAYERALAEAGLSRDG